MFNFLDKIRESPDFYKQLSIDEQLVTEYNCPLKTQKETMWTNQDYFVYVIEGKKNWHIAEKTFELVQGKCIFVKKGVHIVEQFFDTRFCVVVFFISDRFIVETIRNSNPINLSRKNTNTTSAITFIDADDSLHAFFNSVVPYFLSNKEANKGLLELKFRELILNVVNNPLNTETTDYFYSLLTNTFSECIRRIMEENFHCNLGVEEYARMCGRSLSAFKRDFESYFKTTPGRWLLERRLKHAQLLINTSDKSISEIAFESGFENASHFSKAFRHRYGNSPLNYRQSIS